MYLTTIVPVDELLKLAAQESIEKGSNLKSNLAWPMVVGRTLAGAVPVGIILGVAFFLASLAKAHLHESTTLYNRRHLVRLGRLYFYLKLAGLDKESLFDLKKELKVDDLEKAFGSILESSTAFKTIAPEVLTSTLLGQFARALGSALSRARPS